MTTFSGNSMVPNSLLTEMAMQMIEINDRVKEMNHTINRLLLDAANNNLEYVKEASKNIDNPEIDETIADMEKEFNDIRKRLNDK